MGQESGNRLGWLGWGQGCKGRKEACILAWPLSHHLDTRCRMRAAIWTALNQILFPGVRHPSLLCLTDPHRGSLIAKGELSLPWHWLPGLPNQWRGESSACTETPPAVSYQCLPRDPTFHVLTFDKLEGNRASDRTEFVSKSHVTMGTLLNISVPQFLHL